MYNRIGNLQNLQAAINDYHQYTPIRFYPVTSAQKSDGTTAYIRIFYGQGCYSQIGMNRRSAGSYQGQDLSLGQNCDDKGVILHEFAHALGMLVIISY